MTPVDLDVIKALTETTDATAGNMAAWWSHRSDVAALVAEVERLLKVETEFRRAIAHGGVEDLVPADAYRVAAAEAERLRAVAEAAVEVFAEVRSADDEYGATPSGATVRLAAALDVWKASGE